MLPDLEIRVLFCYSPEVLANTYNNLRQLEEDNNELCSITEGILKKNVTDHNITVTKVLDFQVATLQKQWGKFYSELSIDNNVNLVEAPSSTSLFNNWQFGSLPRILLQTKEALGATVVVLQTVLDAKETGFNMGPLGVANEIDIIKPEETFVLISRKAKLKGKKTSIITPTILAHEFGHLMGCYHPYGIGVGLDPILSSSHGHVVYDNNGEIACGTIMSYADQRVWYYSKPDLFAYPSPHENEPCGVVGVSEAYKTVNANIPKLAGIFPP